MMTAARRGVSTLRRSTAASRSAAGSRTSGSPWPLVAMAAACTAVRTTPCAVRSGAAVEPDLGQARVDRGERVALAEQEPRLPVGLLDGGREPALRRGEGL